MRNEIAEWMLSQVAPPERAKTIVGDLLEAQLGPVEFWVAVLRATASIARHQPRRMLVAFFWFGIELGFWFASNACIWWFFAIWHLYALGAIVLLACLAGFGVLHWRRHELSELAWFTFWTRLLAHDGMPIWGALLITLPLLAFGWWTQWRRQVKNALPENDRPVAG
jgi:hypothetical protein